MLAAIKEATQRCSKTLHVQTLESLPKGQRDPLPRAHSLRPFTPASFCPRVSARLSTLSDSVRILKALERGEFQVADFLGSLLSSYRN